MSQLYCVCTLNRYINKLKHQQNIWAGFKFIKYQAQHILFAVVVCSASCVSFKKVLFDPSKSSEYRSLIDFKNTDYLAFLSALKVRTRSCCNGVAIIMTLLEANVRSWSDSRFLKGRKRFWFQDQVRWLGHKTILPTKHSVHDSANFELTLKTEHHQFSGFQQRFSEKCPKEIFDRDLMTWNLFKGQLVKTRPLFSQAKQGAPFGFLCTLTFKCLR